MEAEVRFGGEFMDPSKVFFLSDFSPGIWGSLLSGLASEANALGILRSFFFLILTRLFCCED